MNCLNCQTPVSRGTEYCPKCGFHVLSQRKAIYLSKLYYNQGLEKASVRDLSGAISCLRQSLKFSKLNIQARNLLGLVYFETGEVVAALCEWVISKNIQPKDNLAVYYIDKLQANPSRLEVINRTVNKYNLALSYCRQGNEDMAVIQLKKLLSQNPKLIKAYHLLALVQMKDGEYTKARRTLKKALKIDKTNTTSLRFLREVDEQTGTATDLSGKTRKASPEMAENPLKKRMMKAGNDFVIIPPPFRESSTVGLVLNVLVGVLIGVAAMWYLVVPAKTQQAYDAVNQEVLASGGALLTQEVQEEPNQEETDESQDLQTQLAEASSKASSAENLMLAYQAMDAQDMENAAEYLKNVQEADLSEKMKSIYQTVNNTVNPPQEQQEDAPIDSGENEYDSGYDSGEYDY
ncbi:MAG: tetratricopeptide repeat protein [Eubacteriales bacterium]|nr:tetratricopeptide repeat protein [Eubacteriales bacterium]